MRRSAQILALVFLLASFFSSQGAAETIGGSFEVGEPFGAPNFLFYGLGNINLSGGGITIVSNDGNWGPNNGWPGVVLEKIFFPGIANTDGVFTADVELTIPGINGGNPFPAVINPDLGFMYDAGLVNTSGIFTGESGKPDTLTFTDLPVYAIVPYNTDAVVPFPSDFTGWDYEDLLYPQLPDGQDFGSRMFSLAQVGTLSLSASEPPFIFNVDYGSFSITVNPVNQPPVAVCQNVTVAAGLSCTASASIDNGPYDPDGDPITLSQLPAGPYPLGNSVVTLTATDSKGSSSQCTGTVIVADNTPPTINCISVNPAMLWPPNHHMVAVAVTARAIDNCSAAPVCKILSVISNEPVNGHGDGNTAPDWVITGDSVVNLRAERSGKGSGRVYTITVGCADASGNSSSKMTMVTVPKDKDHDHDKDYHHDKDYDHDYDHDKSHDYDKDYGKDHGKKKE